MSWAETGIVVNNSPVIVRTRFGQTYTIDGKEEYNEGEEVLITHSPTGTIVIEKYNTTIPLPPSPPEIPDINYEDLDYIE
jgi:hypothetical protein